LEGPCGLLVESLKTVVGCFYLEYESQGRNVFLHECFLHGAFLHDGRRITGRSSRHFEVDGTFTLVVVG
jgi:hypothetical protein